MAKKILIIDDEELIIKTFAKFLEKKGLEVTVAKRYEDAMIFVEEEDFDIIVCDIRMPGQNGVETVKGIKDLLKSKKRKEPAIIFITGFADKELEAEAKKSGCVAYLYKPFETTAFLNAIEKGLKR